MPKLLFAIITFGILAGGNAASAAPYSMRTGNDVLSACERPESTAELSCVAWVAGVTQGLEAARAITSVCLVAFPEASTNRQYKDIIVRFLKANSAYRHQLAGPQAAAALSIAFPCPDLK